MLVTGGVGVVRALKAPGAWRGAVSLPPPPKFPPQPTFAPQEDNTATQATGEFEVFVNGKLVHSKKVILSKGPRQGRRVVLGSWIVGDTYVCALSPLFRKVMALWMRPECRKL